MDVELAQYPKTFSDLNAELVDLWARIYSLGIALAPTWIGNRCGYFSEKTILVGAASCYDSILLSRNLRDANALCFTLLTEFQSKESRVTDVNITSYNVTDVGYHYIGLRVIASLSTDASRDLQITTISRNVLKYASDKALRLMFPAKEVTFKR